MGATPGKAAFCDRDWKKYAIDCCKRNVLRCGWRTDCDGSIFLCCVFHLRKGWKIPCLVYLSKNPDFIKELLVQHDKRSGMDLEYL